MNIKAYVLLAFLCLAHFCFTQELIKKKTVDKGLVTLSGIAHDGRWCGVLISQDSVIYYLEDGVRWEKQFVNKKVEVVGQLILEKRKYKVDKDDNKEIIYSAVLPERMLIIQSPSITLVEN